MLITIKRLSLILFAMLFSYSAQATLKNGSEGAAVTACSTTGNMISADQGSCRTTPSKYSLNIFEMGLCTTHPFTTDGTKTDLVTMDKSTCQTTFLATDQTNGFAVDVAAAIGGGVSLEGTNSRATNATYGFPYIILGKAFTVNVSITGSDGNTYVGRSDGNVYTSSSTDLVDNLTNFGGGECISGYVGATIPIGTIDAFLTNAGLERSHHTEFTNPVCDKNGKLVGVINLTTPVTITANTTKMQFNFILTDYGINMEDSNDAGNWPNTFGSAPFSGTFIFEEATPQ
jgi:hypothetical protein